MSLDYPKNKNTFFHTTAEDNKDKFKNPFSSLCLSLSLKTVAKYYDFLKAKKVSQSQKNCVFEAKNVKCIYKDGAVFSSHPPPHRHNQKNLSKNNFEKNVKIQRCWMEIHSACDLLDDETDQSVAAYERLAFGRLSLSDLDPNPAQVATHAADLMTPPQHETAQRNRQPVHISVQYRIFDDHVQYLIQFNPDR